MNQRSKRSKDRKNNIQDIGASVMHTGGHIVSHRRGADPVVRTPKKATGDIAGDKSAGLAKASPFFKKLSETLKPKSQEEEKKVIAEATVNVKKDKKVEKKDDK